jgi:hypothetical protein
VRFIVAVWGTVGKGGVMGLASGLIKAGSQEQPCVNVTSTREDKKC